MNAQASVRTGTGRRSRAGRSCVARAEQRCRHGDKGLVVTWVNARVNAQLNARLNGESRVSPFGGPLDARARPSLEIGRQRNVAACARESLNGMDAFEQTFETLRVARTHF